MKLSFMDETRLTSALRTVLADPYDNALLIANLTALRKESVFLCARNQSGMQGILALHSGMPLPATAFWCKDIRLLRAMLHKMAARYPWLREEPAWCLANERTLGFLEQAVQIGSAREELQLKLNIASYTPEERVGGNAEAVPLSVTHLPDLNALYRIVPPEVWRPEEIHRGPYRGVFAGNRLVAAAGVHWVSPWIAEIGNVSVHPDYRRNGLGEACVSAVIADLKKLTERVYLMVFSDNAPAMHLYQKMGFQEVQRMWLVEFKLPETWNLLRVSAQQNRSPQGGCSRLTKCSQSPTFSAPGELDPLATYLGTNRPPATSNKPNSTESAP